MKNLIIKGLKMGNKRQKEEVSASEFAVVQNDVHHVKKRLDHLTDSFKESDEKTSKTLSSIEKSIAILTELAQQNKHMGQRVGNLEGQVKVISTKIALFSAIAAIVFGAIAKKLFG